MPSKILDGYRFCEFDIFLPPAFTIANSDALFRASQDAVFGVKDSLVRTFLAPGKGDPEDVSYVVDMDFALSPA